jgi:predicted RNA-binding protein with PIN domain
VKGDFMPEQKELILRVEAKKKEFQAELASAKNKMIGNAKEANTELEEKLENISNDLKNAKEDFSEAIAKKLNEWMK